MTSPSRADTPKSKKSAFSFLAWWITDPADIEKQVAGYNTLRVWQSARGISALLCILSAVVTALLGQFLKLTSGEILTEAIIWSTIAIFMYRGHRWAFVLGMIFWTFEKASLLFGGFSSAGAPIAQIIWWAIYMNAFFLAFKVERRRKAVSRPIAR